MRKKYILAFSIFILVLTGCESGKSENKTLTYLESIEDSRSNYFMIFEDKKDKAYYSLKINNYLYDNPELTEGESIEIEIKGDLKERLDLFEFHAKAKIEAIDDEWRTFKIEGKYTSN